jgi:hypothetical protein
VCGRTIPTSAESAPIGNWPEPRSGKASPKRWGKPVTSTCRETPDPGSGMSAGQRADRRLSVLSLAERSRPAAAILRVARDSDGTPQTGSRGIDSWDRPRCDVDRHRASARVHGVFAEARELPPGQ